MPLRRPLSRGAAVALGAVVAVAVAGGVVAGVHAGSGGSSTASQSSVPPPPTQITLLGMRNGHVPWNKPVRTQVANGTLRTVNVVKGDAAVVDGVLGANDIRGTSAET